MPGKDTSWIKIVFMFAGISGLQLLGASWYASKLDSRAKNAEALAVANQQSIDYLTTKFAEVNTNLAVIAEKLTSLTDFAKNGEWYSKKDAERDLSHQRTTDESQNAAINAATRFAQEALDRVKELERRYQQ